MLPVWKCCQCCQCCQLRKAGLVGAGGLEGLALEGLDSRSARGARGARGASASVRQDLVAVASHARCSCLAPSPLRSNGETAQVQAALGRQFVRSGKRRQCPRPTFAKATVGMPGNTEDCFFARPNRIVHRSLGVGGSFRDGSAKNNRR